PGFLDLLVVILGLPAPVGEEVEVDRLADRAPVAPVPIARLAELAHRLGDDSRLLANLALRGLHGRLAGIDVPLREREDARSVGGPPRGDDHGDVAVAHDDTARGHLPRSRSG